MSHPSNNKKRKAPKANVWIVNVTHFRDDYEIPKDEEWSECDDARAFDTEDKARLYMASVLFEWLESEDRLCIDHKGDEDYLQYEEPDHYLIGLKPELKTDYERMMAVVEPYTSGRYVPYRISWEIKNVYIE